LEFDPEVEVEPEFGAEVEGEPDVVLEVEPFPEVEPEAGVDVVGGGCTGVDGSVEVVLVLEDVESVDEPAAGAGLLVCVSMSSSFVFELAPVAPSDTALHSTERARTKPFGISGF
jgi:hypothetical protein